MALFESYVDGSFGGFGTPPGDGQNGGFPGRDGDTDAAGSAAPSSDGQV